jgi:RNA polymerase primary sigma factor
MGKTDVEFDGARSSFCLIRFRVESSTPHRFHRSFRPLIASLSAMITYNTHKSDIFWHGLLNCSEAKVLSPVEERKLLVELDDCKQQILAGRALADDAVWDESVSQSEFQQLIRDLADPDVTDFDPRVEALKDLARRYQELRAKLAMANVRLVAHVARKYHDRGIPHGDLIQEGFCALLVAIDRFDVVNESRLATYAIWWIRQGIQRAVANGAYPVRLNPRQLHQLAHAQAITGHGADNSGRITRSDGPQLGLSPTIEHVFAATRPVLSLDAPSRFDGTTTIGEILVPPDDEESPADDAQHSVGDMIKTLESREQLILKLRFGLGGESPRTLIEVSKVLGVSKERVRQIQNRALTKLRSSSGGDEFRGRPSANDEGGRMKVERRPSLARKRA